MNIGLFATWLSPFLGGIENLSYNIFEELKKNNTIFAMSLNIDDKDKVEGAFYTKTKKRIVPFVFYLKTFRKQNKLKPVDINIAMHWGPGLATMTIQKLWGIPYIVYLHGKEVVYFSSKIQKWLLSKVIKNATIVVANSQYTKERAQTIVQREIDVIHPGVDNEALSNASPLPNNKDRIELFTISRLIKRKGIDSSLYAVQKLVDKGYNIHYVIAGNGEYVDYLKQLAKDLDIEQYVQFTGPIHDNKFKYQYYKECLLFLMPSYEVPEDKEVEGFGIVYLEANASGRYVIAGNDGGISDAVKDTLTGRMINGNNPNEIAEAVVQYLERTSEEKKVMYDACINWSKQHSWQKITKKLTNIIEQTSQRSCNNDKVT